MAKRLAQEEGLSDEDALVAHVGALLHDIADWKYSGSEDAASQISRDFLQAQGCNEAFVSKVVEVIEVSGCSTHLLLRAVLAGSRPGELPLLFCFVFVSILNSKIPTALTGSS